MSDSENHRVRRPLAITVEEFDRKAEAGDDIDAFLDWESGVTVMPGELSPGQAASCEITADLEQDKAAHENDTHWEANALLVSLPLWAIERLGRVANIHGMSKEDLAQLLLVQYLGQQKVAA